MAFAIITFMIGFRDVNITPDVIVYKMSFDQSPIAWLTLSGVVDIILLFINTVRYRKANYLVDYFRGIINGYKYVHSDGYRRIPSFDKYMK